MRKYKKTSDTSIRVLETLKLLSKNSASIHDILHYFEKTDPHNKIYTSEVILKYINTLKVFGFRFVKEKDKYVLLNSPNSFHFDKNDLNAIYTLEKFSQMLPEEKMQSEIAELLQNLEKRFSDETRLLSQEIPKSTFADNIFDYSNYFEQIREYEKYCLDEQRLKVTYKNKDNSEISEIVEPNEIKYTGNNIYLSVYNPLSALIQDIDFDSILKITQMPQKSNSSCLYTSVTFQLKDRLAMAYKLHDSEKLLHVQSDGSLVILNQKEDRMMLLRRLMRYGENCEILSPQKFKNDMKELIKSTLSNYNS